MEDKSEEQEEKENTHPLRVYAQQEILILK